MRKFGDLDVKRRRLLTSAGAAGGALLAAPALIGIGGRALAEEDTDSNGPKAEQEQDMAEVTPPEDLMREHGVLDRVLLIYDAGLKKFADKQDFDPAILTDSTQIIREFIQDYHEKSEEEQVFPRFKRAGELVPLVDTLLAQHQTGRRVTDVVLHSAPNSGKNEDDRRRTVTAIEQFIRMYRPHAAREDTVLFPKLRDVVSANEFDAMAEQFEDKEHELFGDDGFEKIVQRVAGLEQRIGIYDLNQFTPK
jgi:hemerythrin-like domain-containing protein